MATVNEKMTAIADAIRDKTGGTEALTLDGMAENIPNVYEAGHSKGLTDFQNMLSRNGERVYYGQVFRTANFSGFTFNPTIYPTYLGNVFYNYSGAEFPKGIDFSQAINAESVTDTSKIPYQMFAYCRTQERIPDMNIPIQYRYLNTFSHCYVKEIEILRVAETTTFSNTFTDCPNLEEVTFEGIIGRDISFASSPLTVECMKNIISCLKDYSGTENEGTYTVTFTSACKTALESEGETSPNGNTWTQYITDLGWLW